MAAPLSRSALRARDALVLQHLSLADAVASAVARRFFPLVEREDLIQVAREALIRSVLRCKAGEPAEPYLRRCIAGALQHHLRDEQGQCPLAHISLDGHADGEQCLLDQLAAPEQEAAGPADDLALEQLVDQLPAAQATALRLTILEGLSLRAAAEQLQISAMSVSHREVRLAAQRAQKKALEALRQQLAVGGRGPAQHPWQCSCITMGVMLLACPMAVFPASSPAATAGESLIEEVESALTDRYQTTVPQPVRRALGLRKRDRICYAIRANGEVVLKRLCLEPVEDDPALAPFLALLQQDIAAHPERLLPITANLAGRLQELVGGIEVNLDAPLPDGDDCAGDLATDVTV